MFGLLLQRELTGRSQILTDAQITRRTLQIGTSVHPLKLSSSSQTLSLDTIEKRFLLSSSSSGAISGIDVLCTSVDQQQEHPYRPSVVFTTPKNQSHCDSCTAATWYPIDSGMFFSASKDKFVKIWDTNQQTCVFQMHFDGIPLSISPSSAICNSKQSLLAIGGDFKDKIRLCDLRTCKTCHTLSGHEKAVNSLCWHPRNEWLLVSGSNDGCCFIYDIRKSGAIAVIGAGNVDFSIRGSPSSVISHERTPISSLIFSPDGRFIFTNSSDGKITRWDSFTLRDTVVNFSHAPKRQMRKGNTHSQMSISSNGKVLYYPRKNGIKCFDSFSGEEIYTLNGHVDIVNCCAFNSDSLELYSGAEDSFLIVWKPDLIIGKVLPQQEIDNWD